MTWPPEILRWFQLFWEISETCKNLPYYTQYTPAEFKLQSTLSGHDGIEKPVKHSWCELKVTNEEGHITMISVIRAYEKPVLDLYKLRCLHPALNFGKAWELATLSGQSSLRVPRYLHLLQGADYANCFLLQECEFEGESVRRTELGWALSGPASRLCSPDEQKSVSADWAQQTSTPVGIKGAIWKAHSPPNHSHPPSRGYKAGSLWKSGERHLQIDCSSSRSPRIPYRIPQGGACSSFSPLVWNSSLLSVSFSFPDNSVICSFT